MNLEFRLGQQPGAIHNKSITLDGIARDDGRSAAFRYANRFFPSDGSVQALQLATDDGGRGTVTQNRRLTLVTGIPSRQGTADEADGASSLDGSATFGGTP